MSQVEFGGHRQHYLFHDPGSPGPLPVVMFLLLGLLRNIGAGSFCSMCSDVRHGAHTYIYPVPELQQIDSVLEPSSKYLDGPGDIVVGR